MEMKKVTKYVAALRIPCGEHGPHLVTVTAGDEVAFLCGNVLKEHLPFEGVEQQQAEMTFYMAEEEDVAF